MATEKVPVPPTNHDISHKFQKVDRGNLGGDGNFNAGVFVVKRKSTGEICVEKRYKPKDIKLGTAEFEMRLLRKYRHKNIVKYLGGFIDQKSYHQPVASVYLEHCDLGNLDEAFNACVMRGKPFPEKAVWDVFVQLVNAVAFLQYGVRDACFRPEPPVPKWTGVIHRDIKPANVFLCTNPHRSLPRIVLGDFGQAFTENDDGKWGRQYMGGNLATAPPEVMKGGLCAYTYAGDVYAVGATIRMICTGQPSMKGFPEATYYSMYLNKAISRLLQDHPSKRPLMDEFGESLPEWREQGLAMQPRHPVGHSPPHQRRRGIW
ncbi:MAG: hypothetical protein Q9209_006452 [Squamulea sp. 1 TL-2023]